MQLSSSSSQGGGKGAQSELTKASSQINTKVSDYDSYFSSDSIVSNEEERS